MGCVLFMTINNNRTEIKIGASWEMRRKGYLTFGSQVDHAASALGINITRPPFLGMCGYHSI